MLDRILQQEVLEKSTFKRTMTERSDMEKGLLSLASKRKFQVNDLECDLSAMMKDASRTLVKFGGAAAIKEFRIENRTKEKAWKKTWIGPYVNKRGITSIVHFSIYGNYVGSVKKLGSEPVDHLTYIVVDAENFDQFWTVDLETGRLVPIENAEDRGDYVGEEKDGYWIKHSFVGQSSSAID
tara:strand:- start:39 stop:584 length:546 start_codon:yes stop_codon:yes gene_type:complete